MKAGKGIGMPYVNLGDLDKVKAFWFYDWGSSHNIDPRYVPMSWGGADPDLPLDYNNFVMLFNEPDRPEQSNITPENGVAIYKALCLKYPQAKWVVGNTFTPNWLYTFKELCLIDPQCSLPEFWGIHAYIGGIEYLPFIKSNLELAHNNLGGTFWITEFASVFGDVKVDDELVKFFESKNWIARWAYFCNRASETESWYPSGWDVQLFDWVTGEPTAIGDWFINGLHHNIYLPIVRKEQL